MFKTLDFGIVNAHSVDLIFSGWLTGLHIVEVSNLAFKLVNDKISEGMITGKWACEW